jgi:hypothetical protein
MDAHGAEVTTEIRLVEFDLLLYHLEEVHPQPREA